MTRYLGIESMKRLLIAVILLAAPIVAEAQEDVVYYHTDAIGSVRMVTDASGAEVARYDFLPFGESWGTPATSDVRQFAGKEHDAEIAAGLDYFGGRFYRSNSGRFTSVDPILDVRSALPDPQRWNRYVYVANRPLKFVDPDGRDPMLIGGFIGAAVYATWNGYVNVQQGQPWYQNIGIEASKGFLVGTSLGLFAPALPAVSAPLVAAAASTATRFGFTEVEGSIEDFTVGRLSNGAQIAARFTKAGQTLTASILGAYGQDGGTGTLNAVLQGAQAVARDQGARQLVIQAVGVVNPRLQQILLKQGFIETTVRVGKETVPALQKVIDLF